MSIDRIEPPFICGADERCRDDGCPFERAEDAPDNCARTVEARRWRAAEPPKQVADMFYVVDRDGRLWWGANDPETARASLFAQGYTIARVRPDGTWAVVTGA